MSETEKRNTAERYQADEYAEIYKQEYVSGRSFKHIRSRLIAHFERKTIDDVLTRMSLSGKVLDVPCGTGKLGPILSNYPVKVTAGDISKSMMKYAQAEYDSEKFDGFEECDVCNFKFSDNAFDAIVCLRLFQRLPKEIRLQALNEMARVVTHSLVISYSRSTMWQKTKNALRGLYDRSAPTLFHVPMSEIVEEMHSAGFEIQEKQSVLPIISSQIVIHCSLGPQSSS